MKGLMQKISVLYAVRDENIILILELEYFVACDPPVVHMAAQEKIVWPTMSYGSK